MGKKVKWSWTSALVGAASATAGWAIIMCKPRDPTFQLVSINLNFLALDVELMLTVHITNPNIVPVYYSSIEMSIFYSGYRLGTIQIDAGSQPPQSCRILNLPARLNGLEVSQHPAQFITDVRRREMVLDAMVDIEGAANVMWWDHKFKIHMESHVVVDPVYLNVFGQENRSDLEVFT